MVRSLGVCCARSRLRWLAHASTHSRLFAAGRTQNPTARPRGILHPHAFLSARAGEASRCFAEPAREPYALPGGDDRERVIPFAIRSEQFAAQRRQAASEVDGAALLEIVGGGTTFGGEAREQG